MKKLKKLLRLLALSMLIILAMFGVGFAGAIFSNKKEQDYDNEIKTELVEGKKEQLEETSKE